MAKPQTNMNDVKMFAKSEYLDIPGDYTVKVLLMKEFLTRPPELDHRFVMDFEVLEGPDGTVGKRLTYMLRLRDKFGYGLSDLKSLFVACKGLNQSDAATVDSIDWNAVWDSALGSTVDEETGPNALAGTILRVTTKKKEKPKTGKTFNHVRFYPGSVVGGTVPKASFAAPPIPALPVEDDVPAIPSDPMEAALADGWKVHPQNAAYMFKKGIPAPQPKDQVLASYA